MFLSQRLRRRFYLKVSIFTNTARGQRRYKNFFPKVETKGLRFPTKFSANIRQMTLLWPCICLEKSSFPMYMFCWFCLSRVRYIFHFLICISFEYLWKMCLNMIFHFWILLNILPWMIMLLLARHSNENQIKACKEPLPVPCQRNQIVWVLFGWFWSKSGFWLSIIFKTQSMSLSSRVIHF